MTTQTQEACRCGAPVRIIDIYGSSATVYCSKCERYSLGIDRAGERRLVFLSDFHVKRGDGADQRPLYDLEMATELVQCLEDDLWLPPEIVAVFGVTTDRHLRALQHAECCGCTAYDLDRVMGDGRAISELVYWAPGQPFGSVEFATSHNGHVMRLAKQQ